MKPSYETGQRVVITDADGDEWPGTIAPPKPGIRHEWWQLRISVDALDGEVLIVDQQKVRPLGA